MLGQNFRRRLENGFWPLNPFRAVRGPKGRLFGPTRFGSVWTRCPRGRQAGVPSSGAKQWCQAVAPSRQFDLPNFRTPRGAGRRGRSLLTWQRLDSLSSRLAEQGCQAVAPSRDFHQRQNWRDFATALRARSTFVEKFDILCETILYAAAACLLEGLSRRFCGARGKICATARPESQTSSTPTSGRRSGLETSPTARGSWQTHAGNSAERTTDPYINLEF